MNIAILSDIHANADALAALKPAIGAAELTICLGDFVGYYCQVNEVLDDLRNRNILSVRGNHDEFLLTGCPPDASDAVRFGIDYADRVIDADHRRWLAGLPLVWGGLVAGRSFLLSHGSPFSPLADYLYANRIGELPLDRFDFDMLAFGQTHRPLLDSARRPALLNPGSVGQSRHIPGLACAALLDTDSMSVQLLERPYDTGSTIALAREHGAAEWIARHLL